ncbi:right-handed parallel beta-helix repeat-containing protein [Bacteroides acidifaciens]|uniref:right-handed parallel beta-helix repeat-containing protein n=1 Tax=Bacteroides acidifaciens TaxID=85831 RepID=UPI00214C830F|nr:right-handed parallel beta-helix repeat-containing protein [Bacteroides acidifaciens]MCR1998832.1 right-handed parallel beta-helix repeat-containing protein [Bacteroides acidifaciens]
MKTLLLLKSILPLALLFCATSISANKIISVADFGLKPDSRVNAVPFVQKAIRACKENPGSTLVFPQGRYDFWAQHAVEKEYHETNTYDVNPKILAVLLDEVNDLTIDGDGSEFIMHGRMQPFTLDHCQNITLKNFTVDWDIPLTAQGTVVESTPDFMEIEIDTCQYPYIIENKRLTFVGEGWKSSVWSIMQFDPETHFVLPNTGDNLGWRGYDAMKVSRGRVRLSDPNREANKFYPAAGTILVLRHSTRDHAGIFIFHSTNTKMENLKLFHTCGLGILSQYSKDISFNDVHIIPNTSKGRVLSGHDDGFHFMGCSGLLKIENCSWAGLMDDPINIHGTCSRIMEVLSPTRIKCKFMQDMSEGMEWGRPNETIGFIEHNTMRTAATGKITKFEALNKAEFIIELSAPLPTEVGAGYVIENLTCTPDAEIRNCHFGSCRARGLLVSTPGKVVIEDNVFESSGSAILIAGDANAWYESGAVKDVLIRNNDFRYPCNSSLYQFCEAVISIDPEIPTPEQKYPYHRNIRIVDNTFHLFDYPILFARSVDGLTFSNNTLIRDTTYQPYHYRKEGITLEACKSVIISNNKIEGDVLGRTVKFENMKSSDIKIGKNPFFQKIK